MLNGLYDDGVGQLLEISEDRNTRGHSLKLKKDRVRN